MTTRFRVWDGEEMHYFTFNDLQPYQGEITALMLDNDTPLCTEADGMNDDLSDVMQYTGLTDAEGTAIYQGDILRRPSKWDPRSDKRVLVYFEPPSFVDEYGYEIQETRHIDGEIIVLGNRYENPELLDQQPNHG